MGVVAVDVVDALARIGDIARGDVDSVGDLGDVARGDVGCDDDDGGGDEGCGGIDVAFNVDALALCARAECARALGTGGGALLAATTAAEMCGARSPLNVKGPFGRR